MDRTGWRVVVIKRASRTSRAQLTAILFNRQLLFKLSLSANGNATERNATQRNATSFRPPPNVLSALFIDSCDVNASYMTRRVPAASAR